MFLTCCVQYGKYHFYMKATSISRQSIYMTSKNEKLKNILIHAWRQQYSRRTIDLLVTKGRFITGDFFMIKTVLITGCSSGFGKALCDEFSKQNYYVIATARKMENLSDVRADMNELKNMYEVNIFGMINVMKCVLPIMRNQGAGRIF